MIRRTIGVGMLLIGCALGRAAAQTAADAAAAVALTAEQEKTMAGQAQGVTHAALGTVMGAVRGTGSAAAPVASAPAPVANAAQPISPPEPATVASLHVPSGDDSVPLDGAAPDSAAAAAAEGAGAAVSKGRDPFRPFTLDLRPSVQETQILTPLQRDELPQLRLAGVVLDLTPPRAMLQDNSGMGFIVTPGTPIGRRHGVVRSIEPRRVIVEEYVLDYYGREQTHQVVIEMAKDDKSQNAGRE